MSSLNPETREASAALRIPPPGRHESARLETLIEQGYLSLETIVFDTEVIRTREFARARRSVANATVLTPLHADLKAIATWFLHKRGYPQIAFEPRYPHGIRRADVASIPPDYYVEVGQVEDLSRIYHMLGLDVVMRGSSVSSVLRRYPADDDPTAEVMGIISIPFPVDDPEARAWNSEELEIHIFARGDKTASTPNRRHPWWHECKL